MPGLLRDISTKIQHQAGGIPLVDCSPLLIQYIPFHQLEAYPLSTVRHFLSNIFPATSWRPSPCRLFATSYSIHPLPQAGGLPLVGCSPLFIQYIPCHQLEAYPLSAVRHFLFNTSPATSWRPTPCRLFATSYSIYSLPPSMSDKRHLHS